MEDALCFLIFSGLICFFLFSWCTHPSKSIDIFLFLFVSPFIQFYRYECTFPINFFLHLKFYLSVSLLKSFRNISFNFYLSNSVLICRLQVLSINPSLFGTSSYCLHLSIHTSLFRFYLATRVRCYIFRFLFIAEDKVHYLSITMITFQITGVYKIQHVLGCSLFFLY